MASLYPKKISGKTYWYLREMARVGGRPKMVSERYVGTAAEIEALLDARERQIMPDRTRHLAFGDVGRSRCRGHHRRGGRARPGRAAVEPGHLPGAGGAEQGGGPLLQAGVGGLVEANRRRPVH